MREIKFSAWDMGREEMIDNASISFLKGWLGENGNKCFDDINCIFENTEGMLIWMQYTGLKDKNGVEICEGDIIENDDYIEDAHSCNNLGKTIVEFKDGCFVGMIGEIIEVVGNIYENKELLK